VLTVLDVHEDSDPVESERGFWFTATVLFTGFLVTLASQLPGIAPDWLSRQRSAYVAVWPQGWSFFADAASEDTVVVYRAGPDDRTFPRVTRQLMSAGNRWGLGRAAYVQILETKQLAAQIAEGRWTACRYHTTEACLRAALVASESDAVNRSRHATICGPVIFAAEHPERWDGDRAAWRITRTARIHVDCAAS
jgi:hypothetical protein